jgi:hypothetical protein
MQRKVLKEGESRRSCKERGSKANLLAFDRGGGHNNKKCRKDIKNKNGGAKESTFMYASVWTVSSSSSLCGIVGRYHTVHTYLCKTDAARGATHHVVSGQLLYQ